MALHLRVEAGKLNFQLDFNAVESTLENLDLEGLLVKKGKPLAISSVLHLPSLLVIYDQMVCIRS